MRWFVDTSVLIPVFQRGHVHHERASDCLPTADLKSAGCALHSLPEVYATLTRLPGIHRASAEHALRFLETIENRFSLVTLDVAEYRSTIGTRYRRRNDL
jgi:predicted nucleic acid-binding protein